MELANSPSSVKQWIKHCEEIALLDPLSFDQQLSVLHSLNRDKNISAIIQMLYRHLPVPDVLDAYTYNDAIAAMRDLGFFIGILKRHGIEPVEVVPELEYVLLVLMVKTNLPPRDTLIHYTMWNPSGARIRTYTGLADEVCLIESVRMAYPSVMEAILSLHALHQSSLSGKDFEAQCYSVRDLLGRMVAGVVHAKKNVSPSLFATELRFYYDPIKVDYNREYMGPGAVEMPMFVFDHLLWSSDCADEAYTSFKEGYLPYNLPIMRDLYADYKLKPSLVSRVTENLSRNPSEENIGAARAVADLFTVLKSFRMPHKKLAEKSYAASGHDDQREQGSGGYSVSILHHIIALQNNKLLQLQQQLSGKVIVSGSCL